MMLSFVRSALAGLSVVLTSCGTLETTATERAESFSPYESLKVEDEPLQKHAMLRFGLVLSVDEFELNPSGELPEAGSIEGAGVFSSNREPSFGSAAAIDRRGYYLTADHNLTDGAVYLWRPTSDGNTRSEQARVVWRGEAPTLTLDLALLHIPSPVDHVFEWASHFETGEEIIGVGLNADQEDDNIQFEVASYGGNVLKVERRKIRKIQYKRIICNAPVHLGDSGGPFINKHGQLIGIFIGRTPAFFGRVTGSRRGYGIRPDLEWLRKMIEEDFLAQGSTDAAPEVTVRRQPILDDA